MFDLIEFQSADVVIGCRSSLPRFSEKLFSAYTRYRFGIPDILSGLKCYSAKVLVDVNPNPAWDSIGSRIALKAALNGCDVVSLPISCNDRSCGVSRFGASMRAEWRILYAFLRSLHL